MLWVSQIASPLALGENKAVILKEGGCVLASGTFGVVARTRDTQ